MAEQNHTEEQVDYGAQMEARRRNFISHATGAVAGAVAGTVTGAKMLRRSLHSYLHNALNMRNWLNGFSQYEERKLKPEDFSGKEPTDYLRAIFAKIEGGDAQTLSGAAISQDAIRKYIEENYKKIRHEEVLDLAGATVGDIRANAAYRHLITRNKELVERCVENFGKEVKTLLKNHDEKMDGLAHEYFAGDHKACWAKVAEIQQKLRKTGDAEARQVAINKLHEENAATKLFKGNVVSFFDKFDKIRENLHHYVNQAKREHVDAPMFDEMIKKGTEPGRMGLSLRHAHNKEKLIAFAAGTAVVVGVVVNSMAKHVLARNDHKKGKEESFQASVTRQRETVPQTSAVIS